MYSLSDYQISWLSELDRYMKHDVSIYKFNSSDSLGNVDFSIIIFSDNNANSFTLTLKEEEKKEEIVYNFDSSKFDKAITEIKHKFIEFLEKNGNIRVVIYDLSDISNIYLLSSYKEKYEKEKYMYDDLVWSLAYMIRFPTLDNDGYYILSGMLGKFEKESFRQKYGIDMSETFPL